MESGNSSSLHSSSEHDEEYDSRSTDPFSTLFSSSPFQTPTPRPPLTLPIGAPFVDNLLASNWSTTPLRPLTLDPPPVGTHLPPPPSSSTAPRGSRKRARASRRAPTTVLTTNTSNFRQMVQDFTGIPSPPFSSLPLHQRPRLDLLPLRLLRPFSPPITTASASDPMASMGGYDLLSAIPMQLPPPRQTTPVLSFQSLLQQKPAPVPPEAGSLTSGALSRPAVLVEPEDVPSTTQGMGDSSWICSLDQ